VFPQPVLLQILDIFSHHYNINLVLEFMEWDLEHVIRDSNIVLKQGDIKQYMRMLLEGIDHCHRNWVLHRVRSVVYLHSHDITTHSSVTRNLPHQSSSLICPL